VHTRTQTTYIDSHLGAMQLASHAWIKVVHISQNRDAVLQERLLDAKHVCAVLGQQLRNEQYTSRELRTHGS
jgi:hypothetical protein